MKLKKDFAQEDEESPDTDAKLAEIVNKRWSSKFADSKLKEKRFRELRVPPRKFGASSPTTQSNKICEWPIFRKPWQTWAHRWLFQPKSSSNTTPTRKNSGRPHFPRDLSKASRTFPSRISCLEMTYRHN